MMLQGNRLPIFLLAFTLSGMAVIVSPVVHAATFVIRNDDNPLQGFNDPTPAAPVGGNPGTTIGQQRLIAFQFAADIWAHVSAVTCRSKWVLGGKPWSAAPPRLPSPSAARPCLT